MAQAVRFGGRVQRLDALELPARSDLDVRLEAPVEIGPTVDENGVARKVSRLEKARVKLSKGYYGEDNQIAKPTVEEYKEISSGHGHH